MDGAALLSQLWGNERASSVVSLFLFRFLFVSYYQNTHLNLPFFCSFFVLITVPIHKKHRRRSQWGRGIIRKKKPTYLKKEDKDSKFRDDEDNEDPLENGDCLEENGDETGDHSATNDESSCDIMDGEVDHQNGTLGKGSSFVSTEEDSSNESMLVNNSVALTERTVPRKDPPLAADYVNGCASMDSIESTPASGIHNGNVKSDNLETTGKDSESGAHREELVNCCYTVSAGNDPAPQQTPGADQTNQHEKDPDEVELSGVQEGKWIPNLL